MIESSDVRDLTCLDFGMGSWGFTSTYPKLHYCKRAIGMDLSRPSLKQPVCPAHEISTARHHGIAVDSSS